VDVGTGPRLHSGLMSNPNAVLPAMNQADIDLFIEVARPLIEGAQLQRVWAFEGILFLGFHGWGKTTWLALDLELARPQLILLSQEPPKKFRKPKPLSLFLTAHAVGRVCKNMHRRLSQGRVVDFSFGADAPTTLELRLIPHAVNALAAANGSTLSWNKPRDLPAEDLVALASSPALLSVEERSQLWGALKLGYRARPQDGNSRDEKPSDKSPTAKVQRTVEDLRLKALDKSLRLAREDEARLSQQNWRGAGEWLKTAGQWPRPIPHEWAPWVDPKLSFSKNLEVCFQRYRDVERKIEKCRARIRDLEKQRNAHLSQVEGGAVGPESTSEKKLNRKPSASEAKTRRVNLAEDLILYVGRSATDNLLLLREAQPWDLWFHLRDFPGAYGIVRRNKSRALSDKEKTDAAIAVARTSLQSQRALESGDVFEIVIAECRKVRPIKGAPGQVTYHEPEFLRVKYK
jgi:hypothetical protein